VTTISEFGTQERGKLVSFGYFVENGVAELAAAW
jgi:hypothetical protein